MTENNLIHNKKKHSIKNPKLKKRKNSNNYKKLKKITSSKKIKTTRDFLIKIKPIEESKIFEKSNFTSHRIRTNYQESEIKNDLGLDSDFFKRSSVKKKMKQRKKIHKTVILSQKQIEKQILRERFMTDCLESKLTKSNEDIILLKKKIKMIKSYIKIQNMNENLGNKQIYDLQVRI